MQTWRSEVQLNNFLSEMVCWGRRKLGLSVQWDWYAENVSSWCCDPFQKSPANRLFSLRVPGSWTLSWIRGRRVHLQWTYALTGTFFSFNISHYAGWFCQVDTNQSHLGRGTIMWGIATSDWFVGMSVRHFLDWWLTRGRASSAGSAMPGHSSMVSALVPAWTFSLASLSDGIVTWKCKMK